MKKLLTASAILLLISGQCSADQKIAYTREDGGVSIVTLARGVSIESALKNQNVIPVTAKNVTVLDSSELPDDKKYRDAWALVDGSIVVDPDKKEVLETKAQDDADRKVAIKEKLGLTDQDVESLREIL